MFPDRAATGTLWCGLRANGAVQADPEDWGKHGTSGVNGKSGAIWKKVKSWFG